MLKAVNFVLVVGTLGTGSLLYNLEHETRGLERDIAHAKRTMADQGEAMKLLNAEWSSLTRPERLQFLAQQHLGVQPLEPDQLISDNELPQRLEALAAIAEPKTKKNEIDDLLQKMQ